MSFVLNNRTREHILDLHQKAASYHNPRCLHKIQRSFFKTDNIEKFCKLFQTIIIRAKMLTVLFDQIAQGYAMLHAQLVSKPRF